jgi:hypothetical protein
VKENCDMPSIDPRLVTILVASLIVSTLLVATIIRHDEEPLLLLDNEFPEAIDRVAVMDLGLTFSLMATRDLERLELRFSCLYERDPEVYISLPISMDVIPNVARLMQEIELLDGEVGAIEGTAMIDNQVYDAMIMDFSLFLENFNDEPMLVEVPLIFAILTRDEEVRYFEGSPGFFLDH